MVVAFDTYTLALFPKKVNRVRGGRTKGRPPMEPGLRSNRRDVGQTGAVGRTGDVRRWTACAITDLAAISGYTSRGFRRTD